MSTPAGWYDDGSGRQRWWDGQQWTEHYAPEQNPASAESTGQAEPGGQAVSGPAASDQQAPAHPGAVAYEPPAYEAPASGAPGYGDGAPAYQAPAYGAPGYDDGVPAYGAPGYGAPGYAAPGYAAPGYEQAPAVAPGPKAAPVLGFIGLGLAVVGTILACIPTVVTFGIGIVVLLAAFVLSLVAVFRKNTAKWPSIVGIILSVVGAVIGGIVLSVVLFVSLVNATSSFPTDFPTSITSEQPSDDPGVDASESRPSPEEIGEGYVANLEGETDLDEFQTPEAAACIGQRLYDSALSDEVLQRIASGELITEESLAPEDADLLRDVLTDAGFACVTP